MTNRIEAVADGLVSRFDRLRGRHGWLDHLVRAGERYVGRNGDHYAAAITYFTNQSKAGRMDYPPLVESHVPIGSGVTEAACKTVFTQRLKQSGMTWTLEGGQVIVDLRVIQLSGVWPEVYQAYLQTKILPEVGTQAGSGKRKPKKVA